MGLELDRAHITVEPSTCATSLPGVHAIGDIASYPGKLKLILSGFAEAAAAAHAIRGRVFPGEVLHFEYSTTQGVPGPQPHSGRRYKSRAAARKAAILATLLTPGRPRRPTTRRPRWRRSFGRLRRGFPS